MLEIFLLTHKKVHKTTAVIEFSSKKRLIFWHTLIYARINSASKNNELKFITCI